jgi:hypothetical protein
VKAPVATALALTAGFLIGGAAIGPVLSDGSAHNAAALQARFERRTVDPHGHYPEPSPYRAPTPDFGPNRGPALGAYAKKQAQRELRGRGVPAHGLPTEAAEAFGSAARPQQAPPHYRVPDRHTGTSY